MATTTIAQDRSSSPIRETISSHSLVVLARSATQPKPVAGAVCRESLRREQITCFDENPNQAGLHGPAWTSNLWRVYLRHAECKYCVVWLIQSPYTWNLWIVVSQHAKSMMWFDHSLRKCWTSNWWVSHAYRFTILVCARQMSFLHIQQHILQEKSVERMFKLTSELNQFSVLPCIFAAGFNLTHVAFGTIPLPWSAGFSAALS